MARPRGDFLSESFRGEVCNSLLPIQKKEGYSFASQAICTATPFKTACYLAIIIKSFDASEVGQPYKNRNANSPRASGSTFCIVLSLASLWTVPVF